MQVVQLDRNAEILIERIRSATRVFEAYAANPKSFSDTANVHKFLYELLVFLQSQYEGYKDFPPDGSKEQR